MTVETRTQLDNVPDILLDEWASNQTYENHFYDVKNADLGTYIIHEENEVIPNLVKPENQLVKSQNQLWSMFFDGLRGKQGAGGGVMLVSLEGEKYYVACRFNFSCSNNRAEYEGLIHGLEWARKRGIKFLKVFGDSELVVNQIRDLNAIKNDILKSYRHCVWDLLENFDAFNILVVPRNKNQHADRLAAMEA